MPGPGVNVPVVAGGAGAGDLAWPAVPVSDAPRPSMIAMLGQPLEEAVLDAGAQRRRRR